MTSDLWESELLRARQWIAAGRRETQQEQQLTFQRVKSHIQFRDHQRSLQSATTASEDEDEDDLALDFLGDVDASDINTLLQAEAAKASVPPPVELATPIASSVMSSANDLLKPLEMPTNLVSPKLKPTGKATVPMSQLKANNISTRREVIASATLGSDADVQELMQDLQLDVTQLQQSDKEQEEGKTEESTPPHLLKIYGAITKGASNGSTQDKLGRLASNGIGSGRAAPSSYMQQATSKSPMEPHRKLAAATGTAATSKTDDVAAEMLSWVSGYRDPAVIRRKEDMARRKRKTTHRYGANSEEERRQALLELKQITHRSSSNSSESDSNSDGDFSSDYSSAEDVPEQEEPEEVDLLSDDYLNTDEDKQPKRRKRLRQTQVKQKKKTRSRKPIITRGADDDEFSDTGTIDLEGEELSVESEESNHKEKSDATEVITDSSMDVEQATEMLNSHSKPTDPETEILDDDDVISDDLGLNYSDDSNAGQQAARDENNAASSDQKTADEKQDNSDPKQKDAGGKKETKAGVQQFFDFAPLTLKPKAKTTTRKKIPIHDYAETHLNKSGNPAGKTTDEPKKTPVTTTKPPIGSNGLRPSKKPLATTTSIDGKENASDVHEEGGYKRPSRFKKMQAEAAQKGALATFDNNDDDVFISDSDDEGLVIKETEDIRFNLDSISVDEGLMAKQVYVTGVNPTVCSEQLEEDFARFGVAVDRDMGFPAIDIFPCQRNHLGRGDACITFDTEDGAQAAVEELNSKNIKNSMIRVRRMDVHTQRILTVQFKTMELRVQDLVGVGVGCPGVVLPGGVVHAAANFPTWSGVPLQKLLADRISRLVQVCNDADVAIMAEQWVGTAHGVKSFLMITLGTGVGFGIVDDGHLVRGGTNAIEGGHMTVWMLSTRVHRGVHVGQRAIA
ncbi:hypothetical protein BBP00_00008442 [Phytophthora kernoviae]|uniref:RRM domain-containing protein n=1 Tax=Phytophthora kernoviae TaxID=325452 RepID=A0A3F2RFT8_9STRA|nr:hypothetical protein BBP00_00008442 [Phytophthora kernoviae]